MPVTTETCVHLRPEVYEIRRSSGTPSTSNAVASASAFLAAGTPSPADHTFPEASAK